MSVATWLTHPPATARWYCPDTTVIFDGQRLDHERIDQTKDRGIRPNPERERQYRHERKPCPLQLHSYSVANVLQHISPIRTWIGSVPPRGSGWVCQHLCQSPLG